MHLKPNMNKSSKKKYIMKRNSSFSIQGRTLIIQRNKLFVEHEKTAAEK